MHYYSTHLQQFWQQLGWYWGRLAFHHFRLCLPKECFVFVSFILKRNVSKTIQKLDWDYSVRILSTREELCWQAPGPGAGLLVGRGGRHEDAGLLQQQPLGHRLCRAGLCRMTHLISPALAGTDDILLLPPLVEHTYHYGLISLIVSDDSSNQPGIGWNR